jgi:DeoR/GlpR family transcriptional regulator of sugar metabolism
MDGIILTLLKDNGYLTSAEIVEKTGKSKRTITRVTTLFKGKEFIE